MDTRAPWCFLSAQMPHLIMCLLSENQTNSLVCVLIQWMLRYSLILMCFCFSLCSFSPLLFLAASSLVLGINLLIRTYLLDGLISPFLFNISVMIQCLGVTGMFWFLVDSWSCFSVFSTPISPSSFITVCSLFCGLLVNCPSSSVSE